MKIVSAVYNHCQLRSLDDWLGWRREKESGITTGDREQCIEEEKRWLTQDQIRQINADFNYENYQVFFEKEEEEDVTIWENKIDGVSKSNELYKMQ